MVAGVVMRYSMDMMFVTKQQTWLLKLGWGLLFFLLMYPVMLLAQTNGSLPVATAVPVSGISGIEGEVVIYNEVYNSYEVSRSADDENVYGVTAVSPALVFSTASATTPVVTSGTAYVRVLSGGGGVKRGDLLVSSDVAGIATTATVEDDNVFAIALEDAQYQGSAGKVLAEVDRVLARSLLDDWKVSEEEREVREAAAVAAGDGSVSEEEAENSNFSSYARGTVAALIAIGAIFFIMYTYRSVIMKATLSVGRNPRARNAIMTVSVENIIFALIICAIALFVAIAVLVLPV